MCLSVLILSTVMNCFLEVCIISSGCNEVHFFPFFYAEQFLNPGIVNYSIYQTSQFFKLSYFLQNCFLCWDCCNGDVRPTLDAARCVALGWVLIWVVCPDWLRSFVNWVSSFPEHLCYFYVCAVLALGR